MTNPRLQRSVTIVCTAIALGFALVNIGMVIYSEWEASQWMERNFTLRFGDFAVILLGLLIILSVLILRRHSFKLGVIFSTMSWLAILLMLYVTVSTRPSSVASPWLFVGMLVLMTSIFGLICVRGSLNCASLVRKPLIIAGLVSICLWVAIERLMYSTTYTIMGRGVYYTFPERGLWWFLAEGVVFVCWTVSVIVAAKRALRQHAAKD